MDMLTIVPAWEEAISAWETELRSIGRPRSTRYQRCYHLRRLGHDHRDTTPWQITREHLVYWFAAHDWAPETRRSYRASVRGFYEWAIATGRTAVDPAASLPAIRLPRVRPRPAPNDVVDAGMRAVDHRTRLMIYILALTGLRRAEVAAIHARDLERSIDGWQLRVVGKGGHERVVPVDRDLAAMIRERGDGWIFPGQIDGHLSPAHLGKLVSRALPDGWTAHNLRHRFATVTYRESRDIRAVQELLGHASIRTTQIYTDVPQGVLRTVASAARSGLRAA
ncbi:tyrosine-type recombinase/integrase [Tomitella gaofuii]|uniref:tyrosine-type recombinase/integrase n=1 Tax=Tomitella gaofuii TaxID=2760083 RepID=UPI0015F99730|nr:tyrosine-type recombinase/integrase [Tomitella gaofuii]